MKQISIAELKEKLESKTEQDIFVDVREPEEFAAGHIPGFINIPLSQFEERKHQLEMYERAYLSCGGGTRSGKACAVAEGLSVEIIDNCEGYGGWVAAGHESVEGSE